MTAVITIISTSVAKSSRCSDRKTQMRSVSRADARHQVAGALAAEVFERELQQVLVGGGAQVGADALGHQRQQIGARPAQAPGQQRRTPAGRPGSSSDQHRVDLLAVLERDQHLVHQRHGQVGRHQRGRGGQPASARNPASSCLLVGPGKAPQAQQHPGRRRRMQLAGADRAFVLSGGSGCLAVGHRAASSAAGACRRLRSCCSNRRTRRSACSIGAQREAPAAPAAAGRRAAPACRRRHGRHGAAAGPRRGSVPAAASWPGRRARAASRRRSVSASRPWAKRSWLSRSTASTARTFSWAASCAAAQAVVACRRADGGTRWIAARGQDRTCRHRSF